MISSFDIVQLVSMCKHIVEVVWKLIVHKFIPKFQALNIKYIFYFLSMWMFEERFSVCVISTVFHHSKGPFFAVLMCPIQSPSFTGVKQCTFHWLISNDVSQKEMARRQTITWTNAGLLPIGLLGTSSSEIWIGILSFSFKKIHSKKSSVEMGAILSRADELIKQQHLDA